MSIAEVQQKKQLQVFKNFVNIHLKPYKREVKDLKELSTGVDLFYLIRALVEKQGREFTVFKKLETRRINMRIIQKNNIQTVLKFLKDDEFIRLHGIVADNILDGDEKIIMALVWNIILHYHVHGQVKDDGKKKKKKNVSVYQEIMDWMNLKLEEAGAPEKKMSVSDAADWKKSDGLFHLTKHLFSKYSDKDKPQKLFKKPMGDNHKKNYHDLLQFARDKMRIPSIMEPDDFLNDQDKLSLTTYVSFFRNYEINEEKKMLERGQLQSLKEREGLAKNLEYYKKELKKRDQREKDLLNQIKDLEKALGDAEKENDNLMKELEELENNMNKVSQEEHDNLLDALEEKDRELEDLRNALNDCEETKAKIRKEYENKMKNLEKKNKTLELENEDLKEKVNRLEDLVKDLRGKIGNLEKEIRNKNAEIDNLKKLLEEAEKKNKKLEEQLKNSGTKLEPLGDFAPGSVIPKEVLDRSNLLKDVRKMKDLKSRIKYLENLVALLEERLKYALFCFDEYKIKIGKTKKKIDEKNRNISKYRQMELDYEKLRLKK